MNDYDQLIKLRLKQARRQEFPWKGLFLSALAIVLYAVLTNCCSTPLPAQTKEQQKKTVDALWGGAAEAHKKRIP
jgi:hypothetical protein